jgi:hypothetical protein
VPALTCFSSASSPLTRRRACTMSPDSAARPTTTVHTIAFCHWAMEIEAVGTAPAAATSATASTVRRRRPWAARNPVATASTAMLLNAHGHVNQEKYP